MVSWLNSLLHERAQDWIFAPIVSPSGEEQQPIPVEEAYVGVILRSARIVNVRSGLTRFYGVVHSLGSLPHQSGEDAEFAQVVVPTLLKELDPKHIDRVVQMNHRLLGPVPYVGGDLRLDVGLLSVAAADLAAPYLKLLETISEKAGVAYIGAALSFVGLITSGIDLLAGGADKSILEIGLSMRQDEPRSGWYAAIRAPKDQLAVGSLRVDPNDQKLLTTDGKPLQDYPYLVIEVKQDPERDDWFKIPDLVQAYATIQKAYRAGDGAEVDAAIAVFSRAARSSNDLIPTDAARLVEKLEQRYAQVGPPRPPHRRQRRDVVSFPALESLDLYR